MSPITNFDFVCTYTPLLIVAFSFRNCQITHIEELEQLTQNSLLAQLAQVKESPDLLNLLTNQSKPLFKSLVLKKLQFDNVRNSILNDIQTGNGASTALTQMDILINDLDTLISANAPNFGVTTQNLHRNRMSAEKRVNAKSPPIRLNSLPKAPKKLTKDVTAHCIKNGLRLVMFYDVRQVYELMGWEEPIRLGTHQDLIKRGSVVFRVPEVAKAKLNKVVQTCNDWGWISSDTDNLEGTGLVAFAWESLAELRISDNEGFEDAPDTSDDDSTTDDVQHNTTTGDNDGPMGDQGQSEDESGEEEQVVAEVVDGSESGDNVENESEDEQSDVQSVSNDEEKTATPKKRKRKNSESVQTVLSPSRKSARLGKKTS